MKTSVSAINKGQTNFSSLRPEVRIGREAAVQVERDASLVDDFEINGYVNRIARTIAKHSDSKFPITVKVISIPRGECRRNQGGGQ